MIIEPERIRELQIRFAADKVSTEEAHHNLCAFAEDDDAKIVGAHLGDMDCIVETAAKLAFIVGAEWADEHPQWIDIETRPLSREDGEVIGYNPAWIDEDFNPNGTRIGFLSDCGDDDVPGQNAYNIDGKYVGQQHFCHAEWCNEHDEYHTRYGDKDDLGHGPNMPTHYMIIPKHP